MATSKESKKGTVQYYVICAVCIFLMFFGGIIPPFASEITQVGMQILGIFIGMVVLWSTVGGIIWPSILAILALGMSNYTTVNESIAAALGQPVVWQVVMAIVLTSAITVSGAGEYLARWVMSRKLMTGRPYVFSIVFLIAMTLISSVTNGIAMMLLSWSILKGVAKILDTPFEQPYFRIMSVFLMPACAFGEFVIPFRSWVGALWNAFAEIAGQEFSYTPFIVVTLGISLFIDLLMVLFLKLVKTDVSFLKNFDNTKLSEEGQQSLNRRQIAYLVTMLLCMVAALVSNILPRGSTPYLVLNGLSAGGIFGIGVAALMMFKAADGKPLMDFIEVTAKSPVWGPFFICAAAIPVANALCAPEAGFMAWSSGLLGPLFQNSSIIIIYAVITITTVVLTNLASNTGIAMMMLPLVVPLAMGAGANPYVVGICTIFSACMGFLLPGSSGVSAAVYGVKDQQGIRMKDIVSYGSVVCVAYILISIILFPLLDSII